MKPEKPSVPSSAPKPTAGKSYDALLEPLPLPEVVESDSDTAWGLWQDSLQAHDAEDLADIPPKDAAYDETAPMDLTGPGALPKSDS